jgi:hypothetical protein
MLTLTLEFTSNGGENIAPFQRPRADPYERECGATGNQRGEPTEQDAARERLCGFLAAAWRIPEPVLFATVHHESGVDAYGGPRSGCRNDRYCAAMTDAHNALKLPRYVVDDLVRVDRLPRLDAKLREVTEKLVVEIDVEPMGASAGKTWPATVWTDALDKAAEFGATYALGMGSRRGRQERSDPVVVFQARTVAARVINAETGAIVAEPELAASPALPLNILGMPESKVGGLDVLGIRLGMPFNEADRLIREHMKVEKVLTADRKNQMESVTGEIVAYTSGRIYASAEGNELIAIFDEPPAAPETVLGIWRILRLPKGDTDPASLKAALTERYGEPSAVPEVGLPMMQKGLAFFWYDLAHGRCQSIQSDVQADLWRDENGNTGWLPPFMAEPRFPVLNFRTNYLGVRGTELSLADFCPTFLGVRYASYDGRSHKNPAGDEIITWLSDDRAYAEIFRKSRAAPAAPVTENKTNTKIKF